MKAELKAHFRGPRNVLVEGLRPEQTVCAAMKRILNYGAEARPNVPHIHELAPLAKDFTRLAGLRLLSINYLSKGKYEGLRISINVRSHLKWKGAALFDPATGLTIPVPEMKRWIEKRRKPRPSTDQRYKKYEALRKAKKLDAGRGIFVTHGPRHTPRRA